MSSLVSSPLAAFSPRQQALMQHLLHERGGLTAEELGRSLGISRTAMDQQLKGLERQNYVEKYQRPSTGGRPSNAFRLTIGGIHLFPKHYALFSELLITLIKDKSGGEALTEYLEALGRSLAQEFKHRVRGDSEAQRMQEVAGLMQELGYEAEAIIATDAPNKEIQAFNCVYHHLAAQHEEVCKLDLALLGGLLDTEVEQTECMVRGGTACRFRIKRD